MDLNGFNPIGAGAPGIASVAVYIGHKIRWIQGISVLVADIGTRDHQTVGRIHGHTDFAVDELQIVQLSGFVVVGQGEAVLNQHGVVHDAVVGNHFAVLIGMLFHIQIRNCDFDVGFHSQVGAGSLTLSKVEVERVSFTDLQIQLFGTGNFCG